METEFYGRMDAATSPFKSYYVVWKRYSNVGETQETSEV